MKPPRPAGQPAEPAEPRVALSTIAKEWSRIGVTGFGGPPAHITLLRRLCVERRHYLAASEFEDGIAATSLLPGPASTQLAIFCAWRLRGWIGALLGGICFIVPGLIIILGLSALFLGRHTSHLVAGIAAGAGGGVPAVAVSAALALLPSSQARVKGKRARELRRLAYLLAGGVTGALAGQDLVFVLLACGVVEMTTQHRGGAESAGRTGAAFPLALVAPFAGGLAALVFVAFKVGALSYGGGFVIIPSCSTTWCRPTTG